MKPLQLDHFMNNSLRDLTDPFDIAWLMEEYDEVMDIYDLNPDDWL